MRMLHETVEFDKCIMFSYPYLLYRNFTDSSIVSRSNIVFSFEIELTDFFYFVENIFHSDSTPDRIFRIK